MSGALCRSLQRVAAECLAGHTAWDTQQRCSVFHQKGKREASSKHRAEAQEHRAMLTSATACTGPSLRPQAHVAAGFL
ncbi:hypothetical protein NDU88_005522 [Pleurodeles waltl]|uniref:Uncharacterized protein n=1 Tax=Pleurodeles waltl TaxID=8319 RepID=A0AAV7UIB4_PLEWA|nr:hypothetical protein NDU88_005522 [Pleurodeles waltl]